MKRQEELERKAAELDRREREMQSLSASGGELALDVYAQSVQSVHVSLLFQVLYHILYTQSLD